MKKKVRITGLPTGQSGLEVKMNHLRAGLGFNSNVMPWPIMAGKMSAPPVKVNSTLKPIPREEANLEAEKDEVAMIPGQGSIPDTYTIGGKRHTQGGTPLNLPENSFIFSDTAKMRIKDPAVLAQFGLSPKKNGYTPAEIAKKYNTAPYKKILADKNTDDLQRETAESMLANYNLKLAKLALIQESMKGFPQGIPEIAMPYLEAMQINPEQLMQQNPGAPENAEDAAGQESAMEIGGPVMAQQPGAPLQYLEEGGPDYFAQAGLTVPAAPAEMTGYKSNFPEGFYNYALKQREDLLKGDPRVWNEDPDMKLPDGSLNYCIDCVGNEDIYKDPNTVRDIARLIEEGYSTGTHFFKPQFEAALKQFGIPMPVFNSKGNPAAVPSGAAIHAYGGDIDYFAMGGLKRYQDAGAVKEEPIMVWDNEEERKAFADNPKYKDSYEAYVNALQKGDKREMMRTADELKKHGSADTGLMSWKWMPGSDANTFQKMANKLYRTAYPSSEVKKEKSQDEKINEAAINIYKKLNDIYVKAPVGSKKLQAKTLIDEFAPYASRTADAYSFDTDEFGVTIPTPKKPMYTPKEIEYINQKQKELFPELYNTNIAPIATTNTVAPTSVPEAGMNVAPAASTKTMSLAEWKKLNKKEYGGLTKRVRITGLPGMAYGGLQKFQTTGQFNGISANSPLMRPGTQLNFNDPNFATQAAVTNNYTLDNSIPADSPLNKPATKLDFTSSDTTQPTQSQDPLAYKDTKVKWNQKTGISGAAKAQGIMAGEQALTSLFKNKEIRDLEKKIKGNQFEQFTPEAGTKGSWSQSPSSLGLIDPNSNIVQQPGYMTMRRNTFGYGNREFGGAMDQYKWGGYVQDPTTKQWGSIDSSTPDIFVPMTRAEYDAEIAAEKAAASKAQPTSGTPKKGTGVSSTIGVYTPEWTKYLTELAKSSGMSIDDPRFKAKLPSYFFDENTGKLRSQAELEKLTKAPSTQKALKSGAFGDEYWEGAYKDDFVRRHKKLIDKFEQEHPGETFDPTKKDLKGGTESSHMKWFQEEYNKMAKEKGAPQYDFGAPNRFGRLSYSVPSFEDFEEPKKDAEKSTAPAETKDTKTNIPADALKYKHLAEPRINTPAFGWTVQDIGNMGRAVAGYLGTRKHMPWEGTPNFYQADTVFDDPTRRIAAMNEQRNIAAQNMAGFTNPQAYMANFMAGNNLGDIANAISDVHSRNINIANQRDAYNAQALNAFDAERANRQTRLFDKQTLAQAAYEAEKAAKLDVMGQAFNTGMKNAADIYNLNQMYPQFSVNPFTQTMYHRNPRDLKAKYEQEQNLADVYNSILETHKNLNDTPEGRKVALEAAKQKLNIKSTPEDPYLEYQRARAESQIPQVNPYADQQA